MVASHTVTLKSSLFCGVVGMLLERVLLRESGTDEETRGGVVRTVDKTACTHTHTHTNCQKELTAQVYVYISVEDARTHPHTEVHTCTHARTHICT